MSLIFNLSNQPVGQIQVSNYALACQTSCIPCMCLKRRYAVPWIDREKERPTRGEFCLLCHCVTYLNLSSQRKQWQSQEFVCADKSTHISISNNMAIAIKSWPPISNMISYCSVKNKVLKLAHSEQIHMDEVKECITRILSYPRDCWMNCWKVQLITHDNWGSIYPAWNQSRKDLERWIIKLWNPQDTVTDLLIEICCTGKCIQFATGTAILYKFTCSIWACKHLIATLRTSSMLKCICTPKPASISLLLSRFLIFSGSFFFLSNTCTYIEA